MNYYLIQKSSKYLKRLDFGYLVKMLCHNFSFQEDDD